MGLGEDFLRTLYSIKNGLDVNADFAQELQQNLRLR